MEKKGLSLPTPAPVKGSCGMEAGKRFSFSSRPVPFPSGSGGWAALELLQGGEPGRDCPSSVCSCPTAAPAETQACGGRRGPGAGCGGSTVMCLLLCGRRNLTVVLTTSSMETTAKIIQQTSVHIALFWCRSCHWLFFFFTLYFKGNSRSSLYGRVKFVSRNAVLGNWHIRFFSRCRM